jgi:hypothetical protein
MRLLAMASAKCDPAAFAGELPQNRPEVATRNLLFSISASQYDMGHCLGTGWRWPCGKAWPDPRTGKDSRHVFASDIP